MEQETKIIKRTNNVKAKLEEQQNIERKKIRKFIYAIILLLLLIILILFLIINLIGRIENKETMPTGNVDIFDVIFGDIFICAHCGRDGMDSYLTCPDCGKSLADGLIAYDKDTLISQKTILNIFTHPSFYIVDGKIAPGSENSYQFVIRNNNDFGINYGIELQEENVYNINMQYKLKLNGKYIAGNADKYVTLDQIKEANLKLPSYTYDVYTLEWKWLDSENDTDVGTNINSYYKLNLKISAEQVEESITEDNQDVNKTNEEI